MCACRCGIRVHLRNGEVRYIDGNPEHPINKGVICAKGASGIMKQYSPARLTQPLLRKPGAERGAARIRADLVGRGVFPDHRASGDDSRDRSEEVRAFHRPRPDAGAHRAVCASVRHAELRCARRLLLGQHGRRNDLHDRRLVLGVRRAGPRPREAVRDDRHRGGPSLESAEDRDLEVQARGGRFISINPVRTGYSAIADEWIPIRPGTDGALLLAIDTSSSRWDSTIANFSRATRTPGTWSTSIRAAHNSACSCAGEDTGHGSPHFSHDELWWDRISNAPVLKHTAAPIPTSPASSVCPTDAGEARVPVADRARARIHAGMGRGDHRHSGRDDSPARAGAGRHRARREDRAADPVDRQLGRAPRDGHRQSGRVPCDARARRAFERLPDDSRARDPDDPARHDRSARRFPAQVAVPA